MKTPAEYSLATANLAGYNTLQSKGQPYLRFPTAISVSGPPRPTWCMLRGVEPPCWVANRAQTRGGAADGADTLGEWYTVVDDCQLGA